MRLDLFLKSTRLIPRRTLAQELCSAGKIKANGASAKSSREVKIGDELSIRRKNKLLVVKVLSIPEKKQVSKENASALYEVVSEEVLELTPLGLMEEAI